MGNNLKDEIGCRGRTILTHSGQYFNYLDPSAQQIQIADIAHGLAYTCRYAGQCPRYYSVAEHSILAMRQARKVSPDNSDFHFAVLMHDSPEAYVGDMPTPLKKMLPDYQRIESIVERVIFDRYNVLDEYHDRVKEIDLQMLKAEKATLFPNDRELWTGLDQVADIDVSFEFYSPQKAYVEFLIEAFSCNSMRVKSIFSEEIDVALRIIFRPIKDRMLR